MARVPYLDASDLPTEYQPLLTANETAPQEGVLNLFRAVAHNPPILRSYVLWARTLFAECGLSERMRELAILAAATELESEYEWHQHVDMAKRAGVRTDEIHAIRRGALDGFDDAEQTLVRYAFACVRDDVDDQLFDEICGHFGTDGGVGITMLLSHFVATETVVNSIDVDARGEFPDSDSA